MKIPNKSELQQIAFNPLFGVGFDDFRKEYINNILYQEYNLMIISNTGRT